MSRSLARFLAVGAVAVSAVSAVDLARADTAPVIVIPSRPGIPVVINGRDASYAVVEGDWGLARPGHMAPTVIGGTPLAPNRVYHERRSYHPRYGVAPERGRNEVEPPPDRALPDTPESFSRSWSTPATTLPVSDPPPAAQGYDAMQGYGGGALPFDRLPHWKKRPFKPVFHPHAHPH